jgi:hypothetical protein
MRLRRSVMMTTIVIGMAMIGAGWASVGGSKLGAGM